MHITVSIYPCNTVYPSLLELPYCDKSCQIFIWSMPHWPLDWLWKNLIVNMTLLYCSVWGRRGKQRGPMTDWIDIYVVGLLMCVLSVTRVGSTQVITVKCSEGAQKSQTMAWWSRVRKAPKDRREYTSSRQEMGWDGRHKFKVAWKK